MLKVYKMPNGRKYRFEEGHAPEGAVLVGEKQKPKKTAKKETGEKAQEKKPNKSRKPANKAKKAAVK